MIERISMLGFSEPISSWTHLVSALFFLIGGVYLCHKGRGNKLRFFSLFVYAFCGVFLFSMSGVYHLLEKGSDANYVLQILDHAGIYLMISGSFTPFHVILLRGLNRWIPLLLIWVMAITGVVLTSIFFSSMPEWLLLTFFISMGWMSLFMVWHIRKIDPSTNRLIFIGGILYTFGAIVDFARWPNPLVGVLEAHEIFHVFISAAAIVHFFAIYRVADFPVSERLVLIIKKYPDKITAKFKTERPIFSASSVNEVKLKASGWVEAKFFKDHSPREIKLCYFEEEFFVLKD